MHTPHHYAQGGSKVTKLGLVALLHVGLALAILGLKGPRSDSPDLPPPVVIIDEKFTPVEPEPVEPVDLTPPKMEISKVVVPEVEFDIKQTPDTPLLQTVVKKDFAEATPDAGGGTGTKKIDIVEPPAPPKKAFTAALANASDCVRPDYPARAARNGEVGTVLLSLLIRADGKVGEAKVQKSSGSRELDRAAVAALSLCKFKPATTNGVAEPAWGQIAYVWSLD